MATRPNYPQTTATPTSGLAIASLVLGLVGVCAPILSIAGIVCGHLGLSNIKKSGGFVGGRGLALAGTILGYVTTVGWIIAFGVIMKVGASAAKLAEELARRAGEPYPIEEIAVPAFPMLPDFQTLEPSKVRVSQIALTGSVGEPGSAMSFRVYLPPGTAAPKSLPCVLIAPAGTNLISGANLEPLDEDAYHDEMLPYAVAGIAVVLYSIDGEDPEQADEDDYGSRIAEMRKAYDAFRAAGAGAVNGRNAFAFAGSRLPMVDPDRIYSAGHSSAATLSLLLAAHEPRLRGCIGYAPAVDLAEHFADNPGIRLGLTEFGSMATQSSPATHAHRIGMPVFLFFAEDDDLVSLADARPFIDKIKAANSDVTVKTVPSGGHYRSMIDEGIPAGIGWIKSH